jgi:hypothetical protein
MLADAALLLFLHASETAPLPLQKLPSQNAYNANNELLEEQRPATVPEEGVILHPSDDKGVHTEFASQVLTHLAEPVLEEPPIRTKRNRKPTLSLFMEVFPA